MRFLLTDMPGVTIRGKGECVRCHQKILPGDRVEPLWIFAGVTRSPKDGRKVMVLQGRTDMPAPQNEYAHTRCDDARLADVAHVIPVEAKEPLNVFTNIEPRGDNLHCVVCKRLFRTGDRVKFVYPVQGIGVDPETGGEAAQCSSDNESVHGFCGDPQARGEDPLIIAK
jgi:hypothetical protein